MRFADAARRVFELGWKIWEYGERELPERHPIYPLVNPGAGVSPPVARRATPARHRRADARRSPGPTPHSSPVFASAKSR